MKGNVMNNQTGRIIANLSELLKLRLLLKELNDDDFNSLDELIDFVTREIERQIDDIIYLEKL
jgi:hypothetical protein